MDSDNKKITQLATGTPVKSDIMPYVSSPGSSPVTKSVSIENLLNGWVEVPDTWTYGSANTINVPSNATAYLQKGARIRFKQGGAYKYLPLTAVAATLLTTLVTSDYTVTNAPITDIAYSLIDAPYGWPGSFNFVPTITKLPAYNQCLTKISGNTCHFEFWSDNRTLTAGAASSITVSLPCLPLSASTYSIIVYPVGPVISQSNGASYEIYKSTSYGGWAGGESGLYVRFVIDFLF